MTLTKGAVVHTHVDVLTQEDFATCAGISGEPVEAPLGIAFIVALRTLIGSRLLPDGAIMLRHRVTWHHKPRPGRIVTELRVKEVDPPRTRFRRVVIGYRTNNTQDAHVISIEQEQEVLWPVTE